MSNEWLTTGQMLDKLKIGKKAISGTGAEVERSRVSGHLYDSKLNTLVTVDCQFLNQKWRILPNYVTLEEAIKAHEDGKTVVCHYPSAVKPEHCKQSFNKKKGETSGDMSFYMMVVGKWTIEDDTQ